MARNKKEKPRSGSFSMVLKHIPLGSRATASNPQLQAAFGFQFG